MPTPAEPSKWLPPETHVGILRFVQDRAVGHRARAEACRTSDGSNAADDKAEECETIADAIERYWGGE
jgi:hypothetical protein